MSDTTRGDDPAYNGYREAWASQREDELEREVEQLQSEVETLHAEIERLKAGRDNPNPLTLDELRERDGKPVYTKTVGVIGSGRWELLSFDEHWLYLKTAHEHYKMTISELEGSYGNSWIAYDRPPKED